MRKHPTSFTLQLFKSDYKHLSRRDRIKHILEPQYYLTSPEASSIGQQNDNPLEEGWKDPLEFHIGNEFFKHSPRWIQAMRHLSKSKLWDTIIAMLLEDACSTLKEKYVLVRSNRIPFEDRITVHKILEVFDIRQNHYELLIEKLNKTIISTFGLMPKQHEPMAIKKYQEGTIFDIWLYALVDPKKNKLRFVLSEYYHWFEFHSKVYMYPLHATVQSPALWVIKEQFERNNQQEILYRWLEDALENRFGAVSLQSKDGAEHLILHHSSIEIELKSHRSFNTVKSILSDHQLSYLFTMMKDISKTFNQILFTGVINFN